MNEQLAPNWLAGGRPEARLAASPRLLQRDRPDAQHRLTAEVANLKAQLLAADRERSEQRLEIAELVPCA